MQLMMSLYTGEALPAVGGAEVLVAHQGQRVELSPWLARVHIDWTAPAGGLRRPVPSRLGSRWEEMPLSEFVPPCAPVPFSGRAPSKPEGGVPVAGAAAVRPWWLSLASCVDDMRFWNSGDRDGATVSRAGLARRVHLHHDHPTGLVCSH